ncbi:hypothetical protein K443DRAFT_16111 [Laccaria amethystina LaAM-08-1]|uniref:Uncharacterized protein n=1 Tax=Laccaria amethystina LaAM-08-1 TaxID=1095629 RepID=A0A0C9WPI6_9AGAR|nr:hypothetical protein K443DRAFT_16111 [Laccaria amethystina LaAM-08-1]
MSAQTLNLQERAATPLNLQKEAAVEIGAPFGAVDDQLPRRRRKAAVDRRTVSGAIDDQLPRQRRKAAVEIGALFLRCRRSARDEEGKLPLRIAARLKSSGLEARFEGFRGVERDLKGFRGVFYFRCRDSNTGLCPHDDPCRRRSSPPVFIAGTVFCSAYAHQSRIRFLLASPLLVVIPIA